MDIDYSAKAEILQCSICFSIIQSKERHHSPQCQCGSIFTDGGDDYERYGYELKHKPIIVKPFGETVE